MKLKETENEDGDQRRPDLNVQSVLGGADEGLNPQGLFDCLEEQFDLPALMVDLGNGRRGQIETVAEEDVLLAVDVDVFNSTKPGRLLVSTRILVWTVMTWSQTTPLPDGVRFSITW